MSAVNSTVLRKGENMKRSRFPTYDKYVLIYGEGDHVCCLTYQSARTAIEAFRFAKATYGNNVRLTRVVLDYGDEV